MRKILQAVLLLGFLATIAWFFLAAPPTAKLPPSLFLVASADGDFQPGQRQEVVIQAFSREKGLLSKEAGLKLSAALTLQGMSLSSSPEKLRMNSDGSYTASFQVPESWFGPASLSIFLAERPQFPLLQRKLTIRNDNELFLLPPAARIFPGHWVSFRLATINRKSGQGVFKQPIRVKMTTPSGDTTINRVVFSDLQGTAVFTTHFHDHTASGIYEFQFSQGSSTRTARIPVWPAPDESRRIKTLFNSRASAFSPLSSSFLQELANASPTGYLANIPPVRPEESGLLSGIKIEADRAFLSYNAPGSEYRQIEVWQNGKLLYCSDLQLDSGRISIPFPHACDPSQPLFFKVWYLADTRLQVQEQCVLPAKIKPEPAIAMLTKAQQYTDNNGEQTIAGMFFTRPGFLATGQQLSIVSLTDDTMPDLSQSTDVVEPAISSTSRLLFFHDGAAGRSNRRFIMVDNELNLSRYRFSAIKVWLSAPRFFASLIAAFRNQPPRIDLLIGEAECRALRFKYLNVADQPAELEKLEGILNVLTELRNYADNNPEIATGWSRQLNRAAKRLAKFVFIPERFRLATENREQENDMIGPFRPILTGEVSLAELHSALKAGGKISFSGHGRSSPLMLSGEVAIHRPRNLPGQQPRFDKLINSRSNPIMVELDFSSNTEY